VKRTRKVLWCTLAVNALIAVTDLFTAHLHQLGYGQSVLGYINGAGHILQMPGFTVAEFSGLRPGHYWTWPAFICGVGMNLVFYLIVFGAWARWAIKFGGPSSIKQKRGGPEGSQPVLVKDGNSVPSDEPAVRTLAPESRFSRRRLVVGTGRLAAGSVAAATAWGFFGEARWFEITQRTLRIKNLPPMLSGLRIVQLSDIHHGTWMSIEWVRQIVDTTNKLAPDLVALTGDYVYRGSQYAEPVAHAMASLRAKIGTVGVMGNHDWWEGGNNCKIAFARNGIPLIDNTRLFITPDRKLTERASEGLCVAGVGDMWEDKCLYDLALGGVSGGMPRLLLSHNPDVAEEPEFLRSGHRVDLMLSGHTHGGQISIPGIGAPVTNSQYGQKYAKGLVQGPTCPVYVNRGLGMTVMPIRIAVRPEIAVIDLLTA